MKKFKVDDTKDKEELHGEPGVCPYCGSDSINYGTLELEGEVAYYPATCNDCHNDFSEWYDLQFSSHWGYPLKERI